MGWAPKGAGEGGHLLPHLTTFCPPKSIGIRRKPKLLNPSPRMKRMKMETSRSMSALAWPR